MSKALVTDASKIEWRPAAELRSKYGVDLRTGTEVSGVDLASKEVIIGATQERVPYESLILASGGLPRRLPIPGKDLANVLTLRGVEDAKKIDAGACIQVSLGHGVLNSRPGVAVKEGKRLVVIGSSFISMELVVAVTNRKLASIDVIGQEEFPFELVLGKQVGAGLKKVRCTSHGLTGMSTHKGTTVP